MTGQSLQFALFLLITLMPSLVLHEYARAHVAERLGDHTPRLYGRRTVRLKPHLDPFGTLILPGLLLLLVAVGRGFLPVFAYAKPMETNPGNLRGGRRDVAWVALAGPLANLALAAAFGLAFRVASTSGTLALFLFAGLWVNALLFVFNLMPIPGLDGSRLLALVLTGRAREVYVGLDQYLPLFILAIFFLLGGPVLAIVDALARAVIRALGGGVSI